MPILIINQKTSIAKFCKMTISFDTKISAKFRKTIKLNEISPANPNLHIISSIHKHIVKVKINLNSNPEQYMHAYI